MEVREENDCRRKLAITQVVRLAPTRPSFAGTGTFLDRGSIVLEASVSTWTPPRRSTALMLSARRRGSRSELCPCAATDHGCVDQLPSRFARACWRHQTAQVRVGLMRYPLRQRNALWKLRSCANAMSTRCLAGLSLCARNSRKVHSSS